jgi:hypothetical protein
MRWQTHFSAGGDNGRTQFNYSGIGGNLIAASLANLYYPESDRGAGLVFSTTLINTGGRLANAVIQEFILRKVHNQLEQVKSRGWEYDDSSKGA